MSTSKTTFFILISMLFLSVLIANIFTKFNTDASFIKEQNKFKSKNANSLVITDTKDHLIWFIQISDIHISIFRDPARIIEFKEFCHYTIDAIKPKLVLASGDLTDAKTKDGIGSRQYVQEWQTYKNTLDDCNVTNKTVWLDIRGNHDIFNVVGPESRYNYFTNYSIQGKANPKSYMYQMNSDGDVYSFIGIDACQVPGPRRPFNFIGLLNKAEIDQIHKLVTRIESSRNNYTIWFGHFPTSCILTPGQESARDIIGNHRDGLVYVCGHLHTFGGIVPKMYTLQKRGFLELELGDWKDNRRFRIIAIDHGLLSFADVHHRQWPIILVTNPKNALFINPFKENIDLIRNSTHIRILAFSLADIMYVKVKMDDEEWMNCKHIHGSLFAAPWAPEKYNTGLHKMEVQVEDADGRLAKHFNEFSLDGTQLSFPFLGKFSLMTDMSTTFKTLYGMMLVMSILPLALMRCMHKLAAEGKISKPRLKRNCISLWNRKLWILSTVDRIFWPLVLYPIYLSLGPWSVGYLVEDHLGVIFAWGLFVNGSFLPGSFTYAYGFIQLFTFQVPLTLILAHGIDYRFQYQVVRPGRKKSLPTQIFLHLPFVIIFSIQVIMAYLFWLAYGTMAFVLGPLRTWSVILAAILWYQALSLPEKCTRKAANIWHTSTSDAQNQTNSASASDTPKSE